MKSEQRVYKRIDGEIQRVLAVTADSWKDLEFFEPVMTPDALRHIAEIYRDFFIPAAPYLFGKFTIFHVPEDVNLPFELKVGDDLHLAAKNYLKRHGREEEAKAFTQELKRRGYFYELSGKNPFMHRYMAYKNIGFMSECYKDAALKVNASFFTFDILDEDSPVDLYGIPVGLRIKDGKILSPPLFNREALLVYKSGKCEIKTISLSDIELSIRGTIYERPAYRNAPSPSGYNLCIIGNKIVSIEKGKCRIPSAGFVLHTLEDNHKVGETVKYYGLEDIEFAIQCGNSSIIDGEQVTEFKSKYFNWKEAFSVPTVPGRYPLSFDKDRAPRIGLGSSKTGQPVFFWAEGASKYKHIKGEDSCGASLLEMAEIAQSLDLVNAINLDGGGSAQILLHGKRSLLISDRNFDDGTESERPIPMGIMIRK